MLPVEVKEQRLSGLLQSLLCGACLGALCGAQGAVLLRGAGLRSRSVDTAIEAAASGRLMGAALAAAPGLAVEAWQWGCSRKLRIHAAAAAACRRECCRMDSVVAVSCSPTCGRALTVCSGLQGKVSHPAGYAAATTKAAAHLGLHASAAFAVCGQCASCVLNTCCHAARRHHARAQADPERGAVGLLRLHGGGLAAGIPVLGPPAAGLHGPPQALCVSSTSGFEVQNLQIALASVQSVWVLRPWARAVSAAVLNFTLAAVTPGILLQSLTGVTIQPWSILMRVFYMCSTSAAVYTHVSCSRSSACASWRTSMHFKSGVPE